MRVQRLIVFVLVLIISTVTGCDFSVDPKVQDQEQIFTVTEDARNRITFADNTAEKVGEIESSSITEGGTGDLKFVAKISPPDIGGETVRASHIDATNLDEIVIGYKVRGKPYGGGVDIVEFKNNSFDRDASLRQLTSRNIDVQEVIYDGNDLYVAAATKKGAVVLQVDPTNGNARSDDYIEGNVAKSLSLNSATDELFVVSDLNHLYRYDISESNPFNNRDELTAGNSVEFRSVGSRSTNGAAVITTDTEGRVYTTPPAFNKIDESTQVSVNDNIYNNENLQIARVSYFTNSAPDVVFVSLNEYGFKILNPAGKNVWWSSQNNGDIDDEGVNNQYYISVTGYDPCNGQPSCKDIAEIYAAAEGNIIDKFTYDEKGNSPGSVEYVAKINLGKFAQVGTGQISHVFATEKYLFVAKGTEGVFVFERL
jgi:archaellum component FlaF (FlaF/FlaG flagellin family)